MHLIMKNLGAFLTYLILLSVVGLLEGKSYIEDLTLSAKEKNVLDEFKERISWRLPHEYMKQDAYLIRWLRARYFDIPRAEKFIMDNLKWREQNRMDTIHDEDWSEFQEDYKYSLKTRSRDGKVTLYIHMGHWDFRRAAISGKSENFYRYVDKILEESYNLVLKESEMYQNTSQGILLLNFQGWNLVEHACLQCIPVILRMVHDCENHYPGTADKLIMVNVPRAGETVIELARPAFSALTNEILEVYGTNRRLWERALSVDFSKDQLPPELGGTLYEDNFIDYNSDY